MWYLTFTIGAFGSGGFCIALLISGADTFLVPWAFWPAIAVGVLCVAGAYLTAPTPGPVIEIEDPPDDAGPIFYGKH